MTDPLTLLAELVAEVAELRERVATLEQRNGTLKRWMTIPETGAYLGCSPKAVYARIERGRIPPGAVRRIGRTVTIDRLALDRTLDR